MYPKKSPIFPFIYAKKAVPLHRFSNYSSIMRHFILTLMLVMAVGAGAEQTITGTVTDSRGDAMPFVTVSVLAQDSTLLTGAITDEQGRYSIPMPDAGKHKPLIIQASYIGYQTAYGGPDFVLREETEQLAEVEVKAKRPLVERQMDKLVLNVSQ